VDGFEGSDPFAGIGVDDTTLIGRDVVVMEDGLTLNLKGPAVTLFQDGVFLLEGIDYTYRFNQTSNTIVLAPLAGIWPPNKVYVIKVNNRDRFVIDASEGQAVADGETFTVTNDVGDKATFEFDKGYSLQIAPTLALQVPLIGAAAGGITDGQTFSINDGTRPLNSPVVFEFDQNGNTQPGNRPVVYAPGASADEIADAIVATLAAAHLDAFDPQGRPLGRLTIGLFPRNLGGGLVHVGATEAHLVNVNSSALVSNVAQAPISITVPQQRERDYRQFDVHHRGRRLRHGLRVEHGRLRTNRDRQ